MLHEPSRIRREVRPIKHCRPMLLYNLGALAVNAGSDTMSASIACSLKSSGISRITHDLLPRHRKHRRFDGDDPALVKIRMRWDQALRQAVARLPDIRFPKPPPGR